MVKHQKQKLEKSCIWCRENPRTNNTKLCKKCLREVEQKYGKFTCRKCKDAKTCEYAFDVYSTNGDCLRDK